MQHAVRMTPTDALQVVAGACAAVNANLETHQRIQEALAVLLRVVQTPESAESEPAPEPDGD